MAPRRLPALMMVRHIESHTSMKDSGPEASAPTPRTGAPIGRSVEKSWPMPPPCCMVRAASFTFSKIDAMSSPIVPMTKQLNSVTLRPVPAPAITLPAGRLDQPRRGGLDALAQGRQEGFAAEAGSDRRQHFDGDRSRPLYPLAAPPEHAGIESHRHHRHAELPIERGGADMIRLLVAAWRHTRAFGKDDDR